MSYHKKDCGNRISKWKKQKTNGECYLLQYLLHTLRLLSIAVTNFSVLNGQLLVDTNYSVLNEQLLADTNFRDFICTKQHDDDNDHDEQYQFIHRKGFSDGNCIVLWIASSFGISLR